MTTTIYGRRGEPLRVEPIEPISPQAPIRPDRDPPWTPEFEAKYASNHDLRMAASIVGKEMASRIRDGRATVDHFNGLIRIIELWRDNW